MNNYWTKKKVDKLTKLWDKGVSARDIALKLGDVSRNAVIGKANRLGLSKKKKIQINNDKNKIIDISLLVPNMSGCKWPIGHPGDPDFYFCGKPVHPGKPYCLEHCAVAYRRKESAQKIKKFFKLSNEQTT